MTYHHAAGRWFLRFALLAVLVTLCLVLAGYLLSPTVLGPDAVTVLAVATSLSGLGFLWSTLGARGLGFASIYALYLTLAHLGLVGVVWLVGEGATGEYRDYTLFWFDAYLRPVAVGIAGLGIGAFCLAAGLVAHTVNGGKPVPPIVDARPHAGLYRVGLTLLVLGAGYMLGVAATGLLPVLGRYGDFRDAMEQLPGYHWMLVALATGITFALATGTKRQRHIALAVFAVPALMLLLSGNRGHVFYPAAAAIAVMVRRGARPTLQAAAAGLFAFFVVIPVLREVRDVGVSDIRTARVATAWTDPFAEIGFTLRPLVETVQWMREGEDPAMGGTYLLPARRLVALARPGTEQTDLETSRFWIAGRLPGQGYSVIAEAFFNFGVTGVIVVLGMLGAVLTLMGDTARSLQGLALTGAIMAALVNNIRNSFIFVPGHLTVILALYVLGVLLNRFLASRPGPVVTTSNAAPATGYAR